MIADEPPNPRLQRPAHDQVIMGRCWRAPAAQRSQRAMRYIRFASTALLILGQTPVWSAQTLCDQIRAWPAPRPLFARPDRQLLRIEKQKPVPVATKEQHQANHGTFYFAADAGNRLRLSTGTGKDLILSVPEFASRPLEARWINPKLLLCRGLVLTRTAGRTGSMMSRRRRLSSMSWRTMGRMLGHSAIPSRTSRMKARSRHPRLTRPLEPTGLSLVACHGRWWATGSAARR